MKTEQLVLTIGMGLSLLCASCANEKEFDLTPSKGKEKGSLVLNFTSDASFKNETRAVNEETYKNTANYDVKVVNTNNDNIIVECKASQLNDNLPKTVEIGTYRVEATYGKEFAASRDQFLMTGSTTVTVMAKDEKTVNVVCTPTCGKVSVAFDPTMETYYTDYNVDFGGTKALNGSTFAWAKTDSEPWYIALDESGETVNYTINLTAKEDYMHKGNDGSTQTSGTAKGSFKLERNKAHKLTIKPNYTPTTDGGMKLTITIDDSTNDQEITWDVPVTWI